MDKLREYGLFGSGLIHIGTPLLVGRYNECLKAIGVEPTALPGFHIDGKGWSPDVAAEKKDPFYLSHAGAHQYAIILTPDQRGKPIYHSYYSFERELMDCVFNDKAMPFADLASRTGLWVEIDPGLVQFATPSDLLLVDSVKVTVGDPAGIVRTAIEQRDLVKRFRDEPNAWSDADLRKQIIATATTHGDLRAYEDIQASCTFTDLECFSVQVFNGTFLLCRPDSKRKLLVVGEKEHPSKAQAKKCHLHVSSPDLVERLFREKFVEVSVSWYRDNPERLLDLWDSMLAAALFAEGDDIDYSRLTGPQKVGYATELIHLMPAEFVDLQRFQKRLESWEVGEPLKTSPELRMMLMRPHHDLAPHAAKVVWRLITKLTTVSVNDLYLYDKPRFFAEYDRWPQSRKIWVAEHLKKRGLAPQQEGD